MKLPKFILLVGFITFVALVYVYQQTEVFRFAYDGQKKFSVFQELLDKNAVLRYNIARSASLVQIGNKVSVSANFQMPHGYRFVKLAQPLEDLKVAQYIPKKENMFARFFAIKRQAEARTIVPTIFLEGKAR